MCGKVVDQYSSDSFRLLALAVGVISDVHKVDLLRLTRAGGGVRNASRPAQPCGAHQQHNQSSAGWVSTGCAL